MDRDSRLLLLVGLDGLDGLVLGSEDLLDGEGLEGVATLPYFN
jgi:hypothetical protein